MNRSPIAASLIVAFFIVGVPVLVIRRLADGLFPTQAYDVALVVGVLTWMYIAKAILDRDDPVGSLVENRLSPTWQANSLVEQSIIGVGLVGWPRANPEPDPKLYHLWSPDHVVDALLPPPAAPSPGRTRLGPGEEGRRRPEPTLRQHEPAVPPLLVTEPYVAQRGDTFWSIAEQRLGDGRQWKSIEQANLGREVAPGVHLAEGDGLRIGWSVLVPPAVVEEAES